jgi:hypothetical protein
MYTCTHIVFADASITSNMSTIPLKFCGLIFWRIYPLDYWPIHINSSSIKTSSWCIDAVLNQWSITNFIRLTTLIFYQPFDGSCVLSPLASLACFCSTVTKSLTKAVFSTSVLDRHNARWNRELVRWSSVTATRNLLTLLVRRRYFFHGAIPSGLHTWNYQIPDCAIYCTGE